ncbi:hypothetical protein PVAND_000467 [Polypedilum vanderplanki]|uniref:Ankyrin repeat protein n=1 Tax=Polypedilum vanderplanki TaxID=319348 RepID=A0A9J6BL17_POLVA|nr:hypothetical protein PVAND_000467 [Polypedilum vanderplanki]
MIRNDDIQMIDLDSLPLLNDINFENPKEVLQFIDDRGFNYLMIASEHGKNDLIEPLLKIGINVNSKFGSHTAASLAYSNHHNDTLLLLLKANSKFPKNFNAYATQHFGLIEFSALMSRFHESLKTEEVADILNIIKNNHCLHHFYNTKNMSAPFVAILNGMFEMYELLITNNIFISSTENFSDAIKELNEEQKLVLRQIHERHAIGFEENHLRVICGSIFVGHDVPTAERTERLLIAKQAFFFLNTIPMIRQILLLIASARCFKIIFDFNRDHIQFIDPTNDIGTKGAFYLSRHIYIAAKRLLDNVEKFKAYGTIVHELCHFAMDLVYDNNCSPYESFDLQRKFQFFFIACDCHNLPKIEPIIDSVFSCYSGDQQNAELIVRVPQMVVMYQNDPERLQILRAAFHKLFEYYENHVMDDIERKIPNINAELNLRCEKFLETTKKKASKWRKISIFAIFTAIIVTAAAFLCFFQPTFVWNEMTEWQKEKVRNGIVKFVDIDVKFCDLFDKNNSEVFETLSSSQIQILINDKILDLNESQNKHLEEKISLIWSNSSEKLRNKIQKGQVNFQGQKLEIGKIVENDTKLFESLNSKEIFQLIKNQNDLKIGTELKFPSNFYVKRTFLKKKCDDIDWLQLKDCEAKNFEDLKKEIEEKKILLIADEAGEGKTTTFKHFTVKLKQNFPFKWISFIELKNHIEIYKKSQKLEIIEILRKVLKLSKENFEFKIFQKLFKQNQTIFLWDGFDEISPDYSANVLEILTEIYDSTENLQFISSRPRYANEIESSFNIKRFIINSYTKEEREIFLKTLFAFRNQSYVNYKSIIKEVIKSIEVGSQQIVSSPLLLHMIANISVDLPANSNSYNLYSIYEEFINQKSSIFMSKGDVAKDDIQKSLSRNSKIDQVYQHFAIKTLFQSGKYRDYSSFGFNWPTNALDVMKENFTAYFDGVSRRGLLRIVNENDFNFDHRTFAEFFVARYLIEKVCNNEDPVIDLEIHRRLNFFFASLQIPKVCDFLLYYPDHCSIRGNFMKFLVLKYPQILKTLLSESPYAEDQILTIGTIPKLLRRQTDLLRILWEIDANQTFANFYAIAYPVDFVDNFEFLKRFSHGLLSNEKDERKFITGNLQRGNFLVSSLEIPLSIHEEYSSVNEYFEKYFEYLNIDTNEFDLNKLVKCENFHEKFLYLKTILSNDELMEIFMRKHWSVFELYIPYEENLSQFWIDFEETFTPLQIQQIFLNPIEDNLIILSYAFQSGNSKYFIEIAKKYEKYINNTEKLRYKFLNKINNVEFLSFIFNYNFINEEILESFFSLIKMKFTLKKRALFLEAKVKEINGIESKNMLYSALGYTTKESFDLILNFYNETFTQDGMRKFALNYFKEFQHVDNFLYIYSHYLPHARIDAFEVFIDYVAKLFSKNTEELETVLRKFVMYIKFYEKDGDKYAEHFVKLFENLLANIKSN